MDNINIRKNDKEIYEKIEDITKDKKDINISSRTIGLVAIGGNTKTDKIKIDVDYNETNIKDFKNLISDIKPFNGINLDTIGFYSFGRQSQIKEINVSKKSLNKKDIEYINLR